MANAKQAGGLVGPTLGAVPVSGFPEFQAGLCDTRVSLVVHLSGVHLFAAGLAGVRPQEGHHLHGFAEARPFA